MHAQKYIPIRKCLL